MVSMTGLGVSAAASLLLAEDGPPTAFHFRVVFSATLGQSDTSFQEVSGIGSEMELEEVVEGGENGFVHRLPKGVKHPKLVLKRGVAPASSPLVGWCRAVFEGNGSLAVVPMPIVVFLLDANRLPARGWFFGNAFPVSWKMDPFNSTRNEVAIEEIEMSYNDSYRLL